MLNYKMLSYRKLLILVFVIAMTACSKPTVEKTEEQVAAREVPKVKTQLLVSGGLLNGVVTEDGLKQFHGIPYAAAPVGDLRWAPTATLTPWQGTRDASKPGPACMQPQGQGGSFYGRSGFAMSEDCLTLNVWTRADHVDENLPVMVWVHGGSLTTGSGSDYNGELLTSKGVVLVTINYRLGRFGFLSHPELSSEHSNGVSGNQGIRDQLAALEWVQQNISKFGGDTNNITIFGESAGSLSMSLLQASPLGKGLFHKVIGESGGAFQPMWYREKATNYAIAADDIGTKFGEALAGEGGDASLSSLRQITAEHILDIFGSDPAFSNYDSLAIVDGQVIPEEVATIFSEGRQSDVPVMIGSNSDEGSTFLPFFMPVFGEGAKGMNAYGAATLAEVSDELSALYPAADDDEAEVSWSYLFADTIFAYPMRVWARDMENVNSKAYLYFFTWHPPVENSEKYRAFHAGEIGYVFGDVTLFGAKPTAADHEFSTKISDLWVQFAKTGNPNGTGQAQWPAYTRDNEAYMELGPEIAAGTHLRMKQMALIEKAWDIRRSQK